MGETREKRTADKSKFDLCDKRPDGNLLEVIQQGKRRWIGC